MEINENKNTTYQSLCDTVKAMIRGNFIAVNTYIKKEEQTYTKGNRRKKIIKIRVERNEIENKKQQGKSARPKVNL